MANEKQMVTNCPRLIDAYKLEDLLRSNSARYHNKDDIIAAIACQPTVDAVEVVRCKDCKKWLKVEPSGTNCRYCAITKRIRLPYDFCSYGERKT